MLNVNYILNKIEPFLNDKREISENEFNNLFSQLSKLEQYEVIDIMIKNNIDYVEEKENSNNICNTNHIENLNTKTTNKVNYKNLLNLTNEQLCVIYQNGEQAALKALILKNKKFIYKIAIKISKNYQKSDFTIYDFFEEGVIGLKNAANRYDVSLGYAFNTYSGYWITRQMERAVITTGFLIRLPIHIYDKIIKLNIYKRKYPSLSSKELIEVLNENNIFNPKLDFDTYEKYTFYAECYLNTSSLNTLVGEDQDTELLEFIPDEDSLSTEQIVENKVTVDEINKKLNMLRPREKEIIEMRYGLKTGNMMTLNEIGEVLNITRERVRQIEAKALKKLQIIFKDKSIYDFYG